MSNRRSNVQVGDPLESCDRVSIQSPTLAGDTSMNGYHDEVLENCLTFLPQAFSQT